MNIVKVTFTPNPKAPVCCKPAEYLVKGEHEGLAISIAAEVFKSENSKHKYYKDAIASKQRVL